MNKFWEFKNKTNKSAELLIYGGIAERNGWFGDNVTPKVFQEDLADLGNVSTINVRINSRGGDVFAGQAINSMLKRHKATINVYVDGLAASIASVIAMAGDNVYMPANSMMMIHNPWTLAMGDSDDFREMADTLDKIRESIVAAYKEKTGLSREEIIDFMDKETWFTAEEAVEHGFADEVEQTQVAASINNSNLVINGMEFDISDFNNFPDKVVADISKSKPKKVKSNVANIKNKPEEGDNVELTVEKVKNEYPDIYNQIKNEGHSEGVVAERERIQALDDLDMPGATEIINKAKYETHASAEKTAMAIIKAEKERGANYLKGVNDDANNVVVNHDPAPNEGAKDEAELEELSNAFTKAANSNRR